MASQVYREVATDSCKFPVESMDSCWLHARNFLGAEKRRLAGMRWVGAIWCWQMFFNAFVERFLVLLHFHMSSLATLCL